MKKSIVLLFVVLCVGFLAAETSTGGTAWENGILNWSSNDGIFKTRLDVRMYMDYARFFNNENDFRNGTMLRRGRFAVKSKLWEVWNAEYDMDIADNSVEVKDMWFSYNGLQNAFVKVGHFKVPFSLNELTSSRLLTFMERGYPNVFPPGRRSAVGYTKWGKIYHFSTAIYGQEFAEKEQTRLDESIGYTGRMVIAPKIGENLQFHLGTGAVYQTPDNDSGSIEYKIEPEAKMGDTEILVADISDVENIVLLNLEGAVKIKNFSIQGEYIQSNLSRLEGNEDATFSGFYTFASWIITGEERPYYIDEGEFGQIIPKGKKGALEFAVRYSHLDLTDEDAEIFGGMANNIVVGLNWYINPNMRIMLNYNIVDNSENANMGGSLSGNDDFNVLQMRAVVNF
ncbi:MAG: porin [Candidatus Cloacimonadota bacterium]|nr:porin [Candidatus Cloacimonadota bacterium]